MRHSGECVRYGRYDFDVGEPTPSYDDALTQEDMNVAYCHAREYREKYGKELTGEELVKYAKDQRDHVRYHQDLHQGPQAVAGRVSVEEWRVSCRG
jgi:hypothetical protein